MRRKTEPIDMSKLKKIKALRDDIYDDIYNESREDHTLILNDSPKDDNIVKQIGKNSIVINIEVPNR